MKSSSPDSPPTNDTHQEKWADLRAGGVCWQVKPGYQWLFAGQGAGRLAGISFEACEIVKSRPMRTVERLMRAGPTGREVSYLKSYCPVTLVDKLKRALLGSPARREARQAELLCEREVPVAEVVAIGTADNDRRQTARDYLLTLEISDAQELGGLLQRWSKDWQEAESSQEALALARKLAEFVLKLHDAGIYQRDFHTDNILVQNPGSEASFYLLDLQSVKLLDYPLPLGLRLSNLAELSKSFFGVLPRSWQQAFITHYVGGSEELAPRLRYVRGWLEHETWRRCLKLWRGRDRRCVRENQYFARLRAASLRGYILRDWLSGELGDLLKHPARLLEGAAIIKDGRSATTGWRSVKKGETAAAVFIKRFNRKKKTAPLRSLIRGSRALRGWKVANALALRRVHTPRPLGVVERIAWGLCTESFLVTEFIEGADNLDSWLASRREHGAPTEEEKKYILAQLAGMLSRLHALGFCQRDLKLSNILVRDPQEAEGTPELWLIDTDGMGQRRRLKASRRLRDLARLYAALTQAQLLEEGELEGWLELYAQGSSFTARELRRLVRGVRKRAARFHR